MAGAAKMPRFEERDDKAGKENPAVPEAEDEWSGLPQSQVAGELGRAKKSQIPPLAKEPLGPHIRANDKSPLPKAEGEQLAGSGIPAPSKFLFP